MNPVDKALWFIESHFSGELSLADIAQVSGVSKYHLSRAFGVAMGTSIQRYIRGRRLSQAARALAQGACIERSRSSAHDILSVALDCGYGSHEAFTRAFRDQFGLTPEAVRAQGHVDNINLVEPIPMKQQRVATLEPPRFATGETLLIAGLSQRYDSQQSANIPAQWQRFAPYIGHIPGQVGRATYGVICNSDDSGNIDYISGVEVTDFSQLPPEFSHIRIAPQRYAVFAHRDHISTIRSTWHTIWNDWLPSYGYRVVDAPDFERYGEAFDPHTGNGGFEIWIPIER
jgi:AraC family transcriptional regulator